MTWPNVVNTRALQRALSGRVSSAARRQSWNSITSPWEACHAPVTRPGPGSNPAAPAGPERTLGRLGFSGFSMLTLERALRTFRSILFFDQVEKTEIWVSWGPPPAPPPARQRKGANSVQTPRAFVCGALGTVASGFQMLNFLRGQKCMYSFLCSE